MIIEINNRMINLNNFTHWKKIRQQGFKSKPSGVYTLNAPTTCEYDRYVVGAIEFYTDYSDDAMLRVIDAPDIIDNLWFQLQVLLNVSTLTTQEK